MRHTKLQKWAAALNKRLASWGGTGPMDGDQPMDLLNQVEGLDPRKAGNLIEKLLKSRSFTDRYSAMGVWDVVVSSGVAPFVTVFEYLGPDVAMAARKGIPRDDDWSEEVERWLKLYARGNPSGKLKRVKFVPRKLKGAIWYILHASVTEGDLLELEVELMNNYTGERKTLEETFEAPGGGFAENADTTNYGGKNSRQQSVLIEAEDEDGGSYDRQVDIDPETGEFTDMGDWGGPY